MNTVKEVLEIANDMLPNLFSMDGIVASIMAFVGCIVCAVPILFLLFAICNKTDTAASLSAGITAFAFFFVRVLFSDAFTNIAKLCPEVLKVIIIGIFLIIIITIILIIVGLVQLKD